LFSSAGAVMIRSNANPESLEHCPDFNERYTLANGRDLAVPYPRSGYNCSPDWSLV